MKRQKTELENWLSSDVSLPRSITLPSLQQQQPQQQQQQTTPHQTERKNGEQQAPGYKTSVYSQPIIAPVNTDLDFF